MEVQKGLEQRKYRIKEHLPWSVTRRTKGDTALKDEREPPAQITKWFEKKITMNKCTEQLQNNNKNRNNNFNSFSEISPKVNSYRETGCKEESKGHSRLGSALWVELTPGKERRPWKSTAQGQKPQPYEETLTAPRVSLGWAAGPRWRGQLGELQEQLPGGSRALTHFSWGKGEQTQL